MKNSGIALFFATFLLVCVGISSAFEKNVYGTIRHITVYDSEVEQVQNLVKRAYLGYKAGFALYDAEVLIDFDPIDEKGDDKLRYAFFAKKAFFTLKNIVPHLKVQAGLMSTTGWERPDKNWGYSYIRDPLLHQRKFYSSSDLGIIARYTTPQNIEFIGGFYNGNGYKDLYLQADHPLMVASAVFQTGFWSFQPLFTLREPAQIGATHDWEWNSGFSANLNAPKTRAGFELVYQSYITQNQSPQITQGFLAAYLAHEFIPQWEVFTRNELGSSSDALGLKNSTWENLNIAGVSWRPASQVSLSLGVQQNRDAQATHYLGGFWSQLKF